MHTPLRPGDVALSAAARDDAYFLLTAWDARDTSAPDTIDRLRSRELIARVTQLCAPKVPFLPSGAHAAEFLRSVLRHSGVLVG